MYEFIETSVPKITVLYFHFPKTFDILREYNCMIFKSFLGYDMAYKNDVYKVIWKFICRNLNNILKTIKICSPRTSRLYETNR